MEWNKENIVFKPGKFNISIFFLQKNINVCNFALNIFVCKFLSFIKINS